MDKLDILKFSNVPVKAAAAYLGVGEMFIRCGLREKILPFGSAVMRGRFSYYISPGALVEYKECSKGLNWPDDRDIA